MDFKYMPTIRVEVDHMKHSIISHLGNHMDEISKHVESKIEDAISCYDFEGQINRVVHEKITREIESYYGYGKGGEAIRQSVEDALTHTFQKSEKKDPKPGRKTR